jgi:hypothetical protein
MSYTARIEHWTIYLGRIYGKVFDDNKARFKDGESIVTTQVQGDCAEGKIVITKNSTYLLGRKANDGK